MAGLLTVSDHQQGVDAHVEPRQGLFRAEADDKRAAARDAVWPVY